MCCDGRKPSSGVDVVADSDFVVAAGGDFRLDRTVHRDVSERRLWSFFWMLVRFRNVAGRYGYDEHRAFLMDSKCQKQEK